MHNSNDNLEKIPPKSHLNRSKETTNLHSLTPNISPSTPLSEQANLKPILLNLQDEHSRGRSFQSETAAQKMNPPTELVPQFIRTVSQDDSFEDTRTSTHPRNSSFSNSNGTSSFLSRSGNGHMSSDNNLSPGSQKKPSNAYLLNSSNTNASNTNPTMTQTMNSSMTSYSSCSSLATDISEICSPLQAVHEYLDKDESLMEQTMYEFLIQELHKTNELSLVNSSSNSTLKDYFYRVIQAFQNEEEHSPFFCYQSSQDQQISNKTPTQTVSSVLGSIHTAQLNNSVFLEQHIPQHPQYQNFCQIQDFENTSNLQIGSGMSSLVFQLTNQKHFRNTMILTFDYFMTPITFLLFIIRSYYLPTPVGMSQKEADNFDKRLEQIRINISQVIRDYADIRSVEFLESNLTSTLLIVFLQTIPVNSKEKNIFAQLQEKIKAKKTQYELQTVQKRNKNQNIMMIPHSILGNTNPRPISASIYQSNTISTFPEKNSNGRPSSGSSNSNNSSVLFNSANISNIFTSNNSSNLHNSINLQRSQPLVLSNTQSQQQPSTQQTSLPQSLVSSLSSSFNQSSSNCLSESDIRARRKNEQIYRQLALYEPSALILYPVELIAKVMSSIDAKWFLRLNLQSLLNSKTNNRQKCPQILKYSQRFNNLVYWFMHLIVSHRTTDMRVNQLAQLIEIIQVIDQDYHSYPSMHAIYTVLSYMKLQLPITWKKLEDKLRIQKKWVAATLEIQRYSHTFNDKYYGYKQETQKLTQSRTHYIPCMNPYFQDIYSDEAKFSASKKNSQFVIPRLLHERISDRLLTLLALQKTCEKHYPLLETEAYKDFRNYKLDESQLFALFKKKSIKDIDDIMTTKNLRFKDLEVYFIEKCKALEPTQ